MFINKSEPVVLNEVNNSKAFIEYSNGMDDIYESIQKYSPDKAHKILITLFQKI